ncbi:MAG: methionyl-tRNA formyltransferase, partial [Bdellovibrionota bacterium]
MTRKLRVVFMGTPEFAVGALDAVHRTHEIVGVYTQPDRPVGRGLEMRASPVKARAVALGLPVSQPEKLSLPGEFEKLQALSPDVIVVVAYGQILRKNVLELPRLGCVNIHSSLLPRWRGAAPIQWAILGGDAESGVSTMHLVEKLDAGEVLLQARTPLAEHETAGTLHDRLAAMGAELIVPTLNGLAEGSLQGQVQDESKVTYASKLTKEMEWLQGASET